MNDATQKDITKHIRFLADQMHSLHDDLVLHDSMIDKIFDEYQILKNKVHSIHELSNPNFVMDRHKIAACLMTAVYNTKPFHNKTTDESTYLQHTANQQLAFLVGLNIIAKFLRYEGLISEVNSVELPEAQHGQYMMHFCSLLWNNNDPDDIEKKYRFVLNYAHVFFLIEQNIIKTHKLKKARLLRDMFALSFFGLSSLSVYVLTENPVLVICFLIFSVLMTIPIIKRALFLFFPKKYYQFGMYSKKRKRVKKKKP